MTRCFYCYSEAHRCCNTRDMESKAIYGNRECFYQLAKQGGGEIGLDEIVKLHEATNEAKANHIRHQFDPPLV